MPVRSLNSSVIKWPDKKCVQQALQKWALEIKRKHSNIVRIGYFGSDLDIIVIAKKSEPPRERRAIPFDKENLPVPADLLVYTIDEWKTLSASGSKFTKMISREAVWL